MTYALVAIVKDAASTIDALLTSVTPHIVAATIVDTGSTDKTQAIVKRYGYTPFRRKWVNFGHNRSEAFALARGTADWLLALDADMTVEIDPDFEPDPAVDCYMIEMTEGGLSWRLPLLLRGDLPWRSVGPVHEYTSLPDRPYVSVPTDKVRVHFPPTQSSPQKRHWHAGMLEAALEKDPNDARSVFYLAQTYRELGDYRAREMYHHRMEMGGFEEERWYAAYQHALLADWPERAALLMAAWEQRPQRLEPLYYLVSELNRQGSHHAAYALSVMPTGRPIDLLFVEDWVYDWGMAFERSISAWWVGEHEESHRLCRALLGQDLPENIRAAIERNLDLMTEVVA